MESECSAVLVRFGEIGIKSAQTRKRMVGLLMSHLRSALAENGIPFEKIRREYGRVFIHTNDAVRATDIAATLFGVVSASPVVVTSSELSEILDVALKLAREEFSRNASFAVRARRVGDHPYSSQDIKEELGSRIMSILGDYGLHVDLESPMNQISIEVRNDKAYIFTKRVEGVGGMPTGSQGKVICTISSGLDSPVAAYKVMKRGCIPVFVNFDNAPYGENACSDIAVQQAKVLASHIYNYEVKMYIVPHGPDLNQILAHAPKKATCILCKRNILRLAREVAILEDADAIVTGEIIGEQASQTSRNLRVIDTAICDYPVFRPCIGDDKVEVEHLAMEIGTYHFSAESATCCTLAPKYPLVHADPDLPNELEKKMDFKVIDESVQKAQVIVLREGRAKPNPDSKSQ